MFDPSLGSTVCNLFMPASRNWHLQQIWLPHELLHRLMCLMKDTWKLEMKSYAEHRR